jgi:hypothetical protein
MKTPFSPPTSAELRKIIEDIKKDFPHEAAPHSNPGKGEQILVWMEENFGPLDVRWTVIDNGVVRFRDLEDKLAFTLTWNSDWNLESNGPFTKIVT